MVSVQGKLPANRDPRSETRERMNSCADQVKGMAMTRIGMCAVVAGALLLAGCGGGSQSREAAGDNAGALGSIPACDIDSASTCTWEVSLDGEDQLVVSNGATVIFTRNGEPVQQADLDVLCWSMGEDTQAGSCTEDGKRPPAEVDIRSTTVSQGGKQWPALAIAVRSVKDDQGEDYLPLPATALMGVTSDQGILPFTVEVACCNFIN